jgi:hypothetical protein
MYIYYSCYSNTRGVTTLPLKEISSRDYEGREVLGKQRMVIEPLLSSLRHEGRRDHFLNFWVRIMPNISENLQTEISFNVGSV